MPTHYPKNLLIRFVAFMAIAFTAMNLHAVEPPKVGEALIAFKAKDLHGKDVDFSADGKDKILVFLRGFPGYQCPLCTRQVSQFVGQAKALSDKQVQVYLIYPGSAEGLAKRAAEFEGAKNLPENFTLVVDGDYAIVNAYGLRWDASRETAYPSTFVFGEDGIAKLVKISKTHGDRASIKDVMAAL